MTGAVAELVLLAVAVAAEVLGAVAARCLVLFVGRRELVLAGLGWLSFRGMRPKDAASAAQRRLSRARA